MSVRPYSVAGLGIEPLMTLDDAAASIGVTATKLRTEIRKGRLTPTVVAGRDIILVKPSKGCQE